MVWTDEAKELVKDLWNQGFSAGQIARRVSTPEQTVSRNAIIGIVHRARCAKRDPATTQRTVKAPRIPQEPIVRLIPKAMQREQTVLAEPLGPPDNFPAQGCCRFTHDDPSTGHFRMCGWPTGDLTRHPMGNDADPWCEAHKAIVFNGDYKPRPRQGAPYSSYRRLDAIE